ncbi:hypothetical protein QCA50_007532 [Cerrena zonata]|uniref:Uncharacterized protein n=1 Tax=Cerrena zonata TaxID=2478898 RepID=A0AAW0G699_9APHY
MTDRRGVVANAETTDLGYSDDRENQSDRSSVLWFEAYVHAKGLNSLLILPTSDKHKQYPLDLIPIRRRQIDDK